MKINRDDFLMMPDEELRDIYKSRLKERKWLSTPPLLFSSVCAALYFCAGFFHLTIFNRSLNNEVLPSLLPIIFFILSFISGMLMFNDNEKTHFSAAIIITLLQFTVLAYGTFALEKDVFRGLTDIFLDICMISSSLGHIFVIPIIKDLKALRECPSFPFDNFRRDITYTGSISGERALSYLEHASDHNVRSVDLDDIFTTVAKEPPAVEEKKPYEEDFFQQHDMTYGRDKN